MTVALLRRAIMARMQGMIECPVGERACIVTRHAYLLFTSFAGGSGALPEEVEQRAK